MTNEHDGDGGADDDLVEADLPGLDPEPTAASAGGTSEPPPPPSPPAAGGPSVRSDWTDAELDRWFEERYGATPTFETVMPDDASRSEYPEVWEGAEAYRNSYTDEGLSSLFLPKLDGTANRAWARLARETKANFRRGIERFEADHPGRGAGGPGAADDSVVPDLGPIVVDAPLPDPVPHVAPEDSVIPELGLEPPTEPPPPVPPPPPPPSPPSSDEPATGTRPTGKIVAGVTGAVALVVAVVVGLVLRNGGDDDAEPTASAVTSAVTTLAAEPATTIPATTTPASTTAAETTTPATTTAPTSTVVPDAPLDGAVSVVGLESGGEVGHFGETTVDFGSVLETTLCVVDPAGAPVSGVGVAATLGADPAGPSASHGDATTGGDGCAPITLAARDLPGDSQLWAAIDNEVNRMTPIVIGPPLPETIESTALRRLDAVRPAGLTGVAGPDDALFLELIPVAPWTDGVPATDPLRASVSIGVATDDGFDGVFMSVSPAGVVTSFRADGLSEFPPAGLTEGDLVPGDVFLTDDGSLVFELGSAGVADIGVVGDQVPVFSGVDGEPLASPIATREVGDLTDLVFPVGAFPPPTWTLVSQGSITLDVPGG